MCDGATTAGAENASVQATSLGWRYKRNPAVTASRVDLPPTQTEHSFAAIPFPLGPSQSLPRFQVSLAIASFLQFRHICPPPFDADALGR